jgi:hypothetical protein
MDRGQPDHVPGDLYLATLNEAHNSRQLQKAATLGPAPVIFVPFWSTTSLTSVTV